MFILFLLVSALKLSLTASVPTSTTLSNEQPALKLFSRQSDSETDSCFPNGDSRDTQDIVLSCLATVFTCTWVAIHPNVPGPKDSGWAQLKRRVMTMVYAMLAPEFIAIWALRQWFGARRNVKLFNQASASLG
jgi:hypothetical protein